MLYVEISRWRVNFHCIPGLLSASLAPLGWQLARWAFAGLREDPLRELFEEGPEIGSQEGGVEVENGPDENTEDSLAAEFSGGGVRGAGGNTSALPAFLRPAAAAALRAGAQLSVLRRIPEAAGYVSAAREAFSGAFSKGLALPHSREEAEEAAGRVEAAAAAADAAAARAFAALATARGETAAQLAEEKEAKKAAAAAEEAAVAATVAEARAEMIAQSVLRMSAVEARMRGADWAERRAALEPGRALLPAPSPAVASSSAAAAAADSAGEVSVSASGEAVSEPLAKGPAALFGDAAATDAGDAAAGQPRLQPQPSLPPAASPAQQQQQPGRLSSSSAASASAAPAAPQRAAGVSTGALAHLPAGGTFSRGAGLRSLHAAPPAPPPPALLPSAAAALPPPAVLVPPLPSPSEEQPAPAEAGARSVGGAGATPVAASLPPPSPAAGAAVSVVGSPLPQPEQQGAEHSASTAAASQQQQQNQQQSPPPLLPLHAAVSAGFTHPLRTHALSVGRVSARLLTDIHGLHGYASALSLFFCGCPDGRLGEAIARLLCARGAATGGRPFLDPEAASLLEEALRTSELDGAPHAPLLTLAPAPPLADSTAPPPPIADDELGGLDGAALGFTPPWPVGRVVITAEAVAALSAAQRASQRLRHASLALREIRERLGFAERAAEWGGGFGFASGERRGRRGAGAGAGGPAALLCYAQAHFVNALLSAAATAGGAALHAALTARIDAAPDLFALRKAFSLFASDSEAAAGLLWAPPAARDAADLALGSVFALLRAVRRHAEGFAAGGRDAARAAAALGAEAAPMLDSFQRSVERCARALAEGPGPGAAPGGGGGGAAGPRSPLRPGRGGGGAAATAPPSPLRWRGSAYLRQPDAASSPHHWEEEEEDGEPGDDAAAAQATEEAREAARQVLLLQLDYSGRLGALEPVGAARRFR